MNGRFSKFSTMLLTYNYETLAWIEVPGSRAISDEMMRHLLMASSSASAPLNTGIQHAGRQQQQQQSHRQPSLVSGRGLLTKVFL